MRQRPELLALVFECPDGCDLGEVEDVQALFVADDGRLEDRLQERQFVAKA